MLFEESEVNPVALFTQFFFFLDTSGKILGVQVRFRRGGEPNFVLRNCYALENLLFVRYDMQFQMPVCEGNDMMVFSCNSATNKAITYRLLELKHWTQACPYFVDSMIKYVETSIKRI